MKHERTAMKHERMAMKLKRIAMKHERIAIQHERIAMKRERTAMKHELIVRAGCVHRNEQQRRADQFSMKRLRWEVPTGGSWK